MDFMLKTKLINTKVMNYNQRNNKNDNPPQAMRNVPRSSGQLEPLVRQQQEILFDD
jgi:hypothetical protein